MVKYDDLVKNPIKEIKRIHKFIGIPNFKYNTKSFDQFGVNSVHYDDRVLEHNLHTIRTDGVYRVENEYKQMIPQRLLDKYGHIKF
jgi:hypothetical protein